MDSGQWFEMIFWIGFVLTIIAGVCGGFSE